MNPWQGLAEPVRFKLPPRAVPTKAAPKRRGFATEVIDAHRQRCAANRAKNPWGLTPAELRVLDAIYRTGGGELAAKDLGLSIKTVSGRVTGILKKMPAPNRTLAVLAYARWIWAAQGGTT